MEKIRWGVLSTAKIGTQKVIPAMQKGEHSQVTAIASRSLAAAEQAAGGLGIERAYGSYEELLDDPEVTAIYNPLPNHLHVPWTLQALEAGKHVLCEKPIALSAEEARQLQQAAQQYPQLKVMEAFMYRFHPQWQLAKQAVQDGRLGELRTIQTFFSYYNADPDNIRNVAEMGGGGLMDIGCYPISLARFLFGREPRQVLGQLDFDPNFGTDRMASAILDFGSGSATFTCSTQLAPFQRVQIFGEKGRFEIEIPFNAPPDQSCRVWQQLGDEVEEIVLAPADQYTLQGDAFSLAILEDLPAPTPLSDAVANMVVIDAVRQSYASGKWYTISRR